MSRYPGSSLFGSSYRQPSSPGMGRSFGSPYGAPGGAPRARFRIPPRLILALVVAGISLVSYWGKSSYNPVTGRKQHIAMTTEQEIALGLQSAEPMIRQFGGLSGDARARERVERLGQKIVGSLPAEFAKYPFQYHLLADTQTVNAFALPGGQVFITEALLTRLETEGQLAGVLGHETGHVLGRHSAEQIAKSELTGGLVGAAGVAGAGSYAGQQGAQAMASMIARFSLLRYGRKDELEADALGVKFMARAGYDPNAMIGVMHVLERATGGGGGRTPDFMSTHPNPGNRIEHLNEVIAKEFPNGVPGGLTP